MRIMLAAAAVAMLTSCNGTALTFGVTRTFSDRLLGTGSNSDPYRDGNSADYSYGVALTTWIDRPTVTVDVPSSVLKALESRPSAIPAEVVHNGDTGYVGALGVLTDWTPTKILSLTAPLLALVAGLLLFYKLRTKKEPSE